MFYLVTCYSDRCPELTSGWAGNDLEGVLEVLEFCAVKSKPGDRILLEVLEEQKNTDS